jgi:hypothetical protein
MTELEAKDLLSKLAADSALPGLSQTVPDVKPLSLPTQVASLVMPSTNAPTVAQFNRSYAQNLNRDTVSKILSGLVMLAGTGAAIRGVSGLGESTTPRQKRRTGRVIEMPVPYKEAGVGAAAQPASSWYSGATSPEGLPYTIPAMLLGAPLAFYGGWKAVDSVLDKQRRAQTTSELDEAKQDYENSLLESYPKTASDNNVDRDLDAAFSKLKIAVEKTASFMGNVPGMATGLGLAYTLGTLPLGYYLVDKQMKKYSRKAILEKALRERARRAAMSQPPEIYAIPAPVAQQPEQTEHA